MSLFLTQFLMNASTKEDELNILKRFSCWHKVHTLRFVHLTSFTCQVSSPSLPSDSCGDDVLAAGLVCIDLTRVQPTKCSRRMLSVQQES